MKQIITGISLLLAVATAVHSQQLQPTQRKAVIDTLVRLVNSKYVYPDVAKQMTALIKKRQNQHAYDTVQNGESFAKLLTADLRSISQDGHLSVEYSQTVIDIRPDVKPSQEVIDEFRLQGARDNFAFRKMEILEGNIGYLKLNTFWPADWIQETAAGAMAFLANSDVIILDLRDNHGFANGGIVIQSYFFDEETHMSDYINRDEGTTRQSWTMPVVPGKKLADKKLYILVSHDTFSAPEDFSYNMQAQKRAIIVGEATGGGAHGARRYQLSDHFTATIPHVYSINPITHTDWEGKGVQPDIRSAKADALRVAQIAAIRFLIEKEKDKDRVNALQDIIKRLNKDVN